MNIGRSIIIDHDQCLQIYVVLFLLLVETLTNVSLILGVLNV